MAGNDLVRILLDPETWVSTLKSKQNPKDRYATSYPLIPLIISNRAKQLRIRSTEYSVLCTVYTVVSVWLFNHIT